MPQYPMLDRLLDTATPLGIRVQWHQRRTRGHPPRQAWWVTLQFPTGQHAEYHGATLDQAAHTAMFRELPDPADRPA